MKNKRVCSPWGDRAPRIARLAVGLTATLAVAMTLGSGAARADEVDDYTRKLIDLDQRVHVMALEFKDTPPSSPDLADRRVLDAQVLFSLKNYEEAATILLDVVEKYPNSRAYDDAIYLLGESLFQARDYYSSRHYFEMAVRKKSNSKSEQQSLQRLVEIALRTGDYDKVDEYLERLQLVPAQVLEPSVPYVRGKYLYFRGRLPEAAAVFGSLAPTNPYYFQARYFLGTVLVRNGDLANASMAFDALLKLQPPDEAAREIQDLSRLALGRILYERSQFDRAIQAYQAVSRHSPHWADAFYELAWTYIKAKNWKDAYRALDLLLLKVPDTKDAPELRLLMGNLNLRMNNFYMASDAFSKTRDEFEPLHRQLQGVIVKSQQDPSYFDNLVGKSLERFDIAVFIPATAAKWVKADPDVNRMLTLASDVGELQRALKDSEQLVVKLERAVQTTGKVGIFPDLAAARTKSVEIMNQLVEARQRFVRQIRALLQSSLSPDERRQLDHIAVERDSIERQLQNLPLTQEAIKARERDMKEKYRELDGRGSELYVEIQSLDAQLVAIEQYYRTSRAEQKIRPEDIQGPVKDLRGAVDELRAMHDRLRDEIAEASRESSTAGAAGEQERQATSRLGDLLRQEQEIQNRAKYRLPGDAQRQMERMSGVLSRADAVDRQLREFDKRVDTQADARLEKVRGYLATEKEELHKAGEKLGLVLTESQSLGGGLAQAMFTRVADRFYDLVVRSDVGIIDVAWGLKDQKTQAVTKLTNQKNLEIKALDEDFKKILEEDR
jgi:tetratricopeptide (TPR) repeat protein